MGLLNSVPSNTKLYWIGLVIIAISSIVFFASVWYSIFPPFASLASSDNFDTGVFANLTNSIPVFVGSIIFIVLGTHMAVSGRKKV